MRRKKPLSIAERCKRWRQRHPNQTAVNNKAWRDRNPGWYRGRNYVTLLENALYWGNDKAKVFTEAGMTWNEWTTQCGITESFRSLSNGSKLVPVKSWSEFDLNDPAQVKAFLAPGNFRLISK